MTPRYFRPETTQRDRWMVSYLDVVTMLLILFLTMSAKMLERSRQDSRVTPSPVPAAPILAAPVPAATPVARVSAPESSSTLLSAQERLKQHGLDLRLEPRGLVISIPQAILFSSGEDRVTPQALPILAGIADVLRDIPNQVTLVGHADAVPIHNRHFQNNWDLAAARGLRILNLLSHRFGIEESRLSVASYGPYRPAGPNATADGRSRNRRVEIVISESDPP